MSRTKGSKNIAEQSLPPTLDLEPSDRISYLANAIVDRLLRDQATGHLLLKLMKVSLP